MSDMHNEVMRRLGRPNVPDLQAALAEAHAEIERLRDERDEARTEVERLRARVEDYHRSLVALSTLWHAASNERDEAADEIERLRADLARLRQAEATFHEDYRQRCDVKTKALHIEVERLRAEIERVRAEREGLLAAIRQAESARDSLWADRDTARALAEQFQHELDTVNRLANLDQQQLIEARALITAVAQSGVSWTTRDYVVAQIDKATWDAVQQIGGGA